MIYLIQMKKKMYYNIWESPFKIRFQKKRISPYVGLEPTEVLYLQGRKRKKFRSFFGSNENFNKSFRKQLTFKSGWYCNSNQNVPMPYKISLSVFFKTWLAFFLPSLTDVGLLLIVSSMEIQQTKWILIAKLWHMIWSLSLPTLMF